MNDRDLLNKAYEAAKKTYSPYSRFPVGAALECADGTVFTGCNVENAALGDTMCAERVAVYKAISEGHTQFVRMAVYCEGESYCMPCGSCRQVLSEFSSDMELLCAKGGGRYVSYTLGQLLPHAFSLSKDR